MYLKLTGNEMKIIKELQRLVPKERGDLINWLKYFENEIIAFQKSFKTIKLNVVHKITNEEFEVIESLQYEGKYYIIDGKKEYIGSYIEIKDCEVFLCK